MTATLLLLALAAGAGPATPPRAATACPAYSGGLPLKGGAVYDGPPEENAILKPDDGEDGDDTRSIWPDLRYVYEAGRTVWLGCSYVADALTYVELKKPVRTCRYDERRRPARLYCR